MRRSKRSPGPVPQVSRFELVLIVKTAIVSGRADVTFELAPENDDAVVDACWWLTIHTATDEVDFLVSPDGWYFAREDEQGYFEDTVERPRLSEVLREL